MNNDIFRPKQRSQQPATSLSPTTVGTSPRVRARPATQQPQLPTMNEVPGESVIARHKRRLPRKLLWAIGCIVILMVATGAPFAWYRNALLPVNSSDNSKVRVEIKSGSSLSGIGKLLEEKRLIRSSLAFDIYTRLGSTSASLQAGTYSFSPSQTMGDVVRALSAGHVNRFSITFLPGSTLTDPSDSPTDKKTDIRSVLLREGYSQKEIDDAFTHSYDSPLLADKPLSSSLEGYIYGETYNFDSNTTVEQILSRTFDEYYAKLTKNGLIDSFKAKGLSLYEGITLASIVQREVTSADDQAKVAQVFLTRLGMGMPLGSDVTYQYAAKQRGVPASPELDSPYNTRKVTGLPPGPIASPGLTALGAIAHPASTDYLYFLSGDDDVTYFAHTSEEHEVNIANHCKIKCSTN